MSSTVISFNYDRSKVKAGIVHIGVGNFHRAHEEFFTNKLLEDDSQQNWGICGAMLLPFDERIFHALKKQDNIYTLTVCGSNGVDKAYQIGSLVELLWGYENPQAVIDKIACKEIKIITLTITEGGYNIDKASGKFMVDNEAVRYDIAHPDAPKTAFGFVAEGLRRRIAKDSGPITILSCDNLQHNGTTAEKAFKAFFHAQDEKLAAWVEKNVTFPNSMVDRITPATTPADVERLNKKNGTHDEAPVYCEDFLQWVVEDNFIAGRPAWERAGAEFTDDVTAYENMKLSLLNASHTMLSYPAFLSGYRKVDEAMHDERFAKYLRTYMDKDITPYVPAPSNTDLDTYKQTLIQRFGNCSVSDQLSRLCFDGISKIPVYVMPNLAKMISDHADLTRVAFMIAVYRRYLKFHTDDKGENFDIAEPWLTEDDKKCIASDEPLDFLLLSAFQSIDLKASKEFTGLYLRMTDEITKKGIFPVLETIF